MEPQVMRIKSGAEFIAIIRGDHGEWELAAGGKSGQSHSAKIATALEDHVHVVTITSTEDPKRLGEAWISARVRSLRGTTIEYVSLAGVLTSIRGELTARFCGERE